jgi:hypothetical protein
MTEDWILVIYRDEKDVSDWMDEQIEKCKSDEYELDDEGFLVKRKFDLGDICEPITQRYSYLKLNDDRDLWGIAGMQYHAFWFCPTRRGYSADEINYILGRQTEQEFSTTGECELMVAPKFGGNDDR